MKMGPIGVFDSGMGGLTILKPIREKLPDFDVIYLGDNARAPYGAHSFDTIYRYTRECVSHLFGMGCRLVILACNTASARSLRTLQQRDLKNSADPNRRILGVIRPTVEAISQYTRTGSVGIVGTKGTIRSESYPLEIRHLDPSLKVYQQACPMWVPIVESGEGVDNPGTLYFLRRDMESLLAQSDDIDTVLLGCTHYPLLLPLLEGMGFGGIRWLTQGDIVAKSLTEYLRRHPEMEKSLSRGGELRLLTTGNGEDFVMRGGAFQEYYPDGVQVEEVTVRQGLTL